MLELRLAKAEDCPKVAALEKKCFSHPQSEKSFSEQVDHPTAALFTAWWSGEFCGYLSVYLVFDRAQILTIAVDEAFRRRGIGKALLEALFSHARRANCVAVELEVRSRNASAIALYESLGFHTVGLRKNYYRDPADDAVLMDRDLD